MDIVNILVGIFMIGIGFLVKSSPNLIAGYNAMSWEEKQNVKIGKLSTFIRNSFIVMGTTIVLGYYAFKYVGFLLLADSMILIITLSGVAIMIISAKKFDINKKAKKTQTLTNIILAFVVLLLVYPITYGIIPSKAIITNKTVTLSGLYGLKIPISDIKLIELTDKVPSINYRTNGFSLGKISKGEFILKNFGKCHLLINSSYPLYIIISTKNRDKIILNFEDNEETEKNYYKIKTAQRIEKR